MNTAHANRVLVVDDEPHICESVKVALERSGCSVEVAETAERALNKLDEEPVQLVLCDIKLPSMDGIELLERIRTSFPRTAVVMITGYATIDSAVASIQRGAANYLPKPFNPQQLRHIVSQVLEHQRLTAENEYLKGELHSAQGDKAIVGESAAMQRVLAQAQTVAPTDSSILILGESGTGKEVLARQIHAWSPRKDRPFVAVNCAAIPQALLESELFGHSRGAFTGAISNRRGSLLLAAGGTLFLDEIGEMPVEMQAKILRVLEDRQVQPVGAERAVPVDFRVIAATHANLETQMKGGTFREDLYWRLNVVQLAMPPLRERQGDVEALARHFVALFGRDLKKPDVSLAPEALNALVRYSWPGNVRELRNTMERAVIFSPPDRPIRVHDLPPHLLAPAKALPAPGKGFVTLRELELNYMREVTQACGGNRTRAAEVLGVSPVTLWRRLGKDGDGEDGAGS